MKIRVLIKDPGKKPRIVKIENSLKNLQATVGGYIEVAMLYTDAAIVYNCNVCGIDFVGTIVFAGVNGEDFCDFPLSYAEAKRLLPELWRTDGGVAIHG